MQNHLVGACLATCAWAVQAAPMPFHTWVQIRVTACQPAVLGQPLVIVSSRETRTFGATEGEGTKVTLLAGYVVHSAHYAPRELRAQLPEHYKKEFGKGLSTPGVMTVLFIHQDAATFCKEQVKLEMNFRLLLNCDQVSLQGCSAHLPFAEVIPPPALEELLHPVAN